MSAMPFYVSVPVPLPVCTRPLSAVPISEILPIKDTLDKACLLVLFYLS